MYKSNLLDLEQQTLNASMNRHFIFNALNSIQYFINTQDKISANKYLTSFAKLIRKNLDSSSSGNNLIPLSDELERLELYLSLEHMRFQSKFDYNIFIQPKVTSESILVPAMFMQPFVENSIWHGVLPMEKKGEINISIEVTLEKEIRIKKIGKYCFIVSNFIMTPFIEKLLDHIYSIPSYFEMIRKSFQSISYETHI